MKKCTKCKLLKPLCLFNRDNSRGSGLCFRCKDCDRLYRSANRARLSETNRVWREGSREERRAYSWSYWRERQERDVGYYISTRLRNRVKMALTRGLRSGKFWDLTGCTIGELLEHIERQFTSGMSWENRGQWHLDHIRPCASFDLSDPEQQRACFHFTNLQPLWARDNLAKGARYENQEKAA